MKTIPTLSVLLCCFWYGTGFAQVATVSEELPFRDDDNFEILGKFQEHILVFRDNPFGRDLFAYDEKMTLSWEKPIEIEGKNSKIAGYIKLRGGFGVVYTYREEGEVFCNLQTFDAAGKPLDTVQVYSFGKKYFTPKPKLFYSENDRQVIIYTVERNNNAIILSYDLKKRELNWVSKFSLPTYLHFNRNFSAGLVNNSGEFFLIFSRNNRKNKSEEHFYEIHQFSRGRDIAKLHKLPLGGKLSFDVSFVYDNLNDQIIGGGMYSQDDEDRTDGTFYLTFMPNHGDIYQVFFHPFSKDFLQTVLGKHYKKNKDFLTDARIQHLVLRQDGGLIAIGEINKIYERFSSNGNRSFVGSNYVVDYFYENMFVFSFNPDGEVHWNTILHKRQVSQDDNARYSSFFLAKTTSALRLLYNDDIRLGSTVSAYTLTPSGAVRRSSILSTKNQNIKLRFVDAIQVASDEIIVPSDYRSQFKLVRIKG